MNMTLQGCEWDFEKRAEIIIKTKIQINGCSAGGGGEPEEGQPLSCKLDVILKLEVYLTPFGATCVKDGRVSVSSYKCGFSMIWMY